MKLHETLFTSVNIQTYAPSRSTQINESAVSFGGMQKIIYAYVLKTMKSVPSDAKFEAENDRFWTEEFDSVLSDFKSDDVDSIMSSLERAIQEVSAIIVDHYGNAMNHAPGTKVVKLKQIGDISDKDLMKLIQDIDPKLIERDAEDKKKAAESKASVAAESKKAAAKRIEDVAKVFKKFQATGWADFLKVVHKEVKTNVKMALDYFPSYVKEADVLAIKTVDDLKALFKSPGDFISSIAQSIDELPASKLTPEETYLNGLGYVISRSPALSKKLMAMVNESLSEAANGIGWYVTDKNDKNVAGPMTEVAARAKCKLLGGDTKGYDVSYVSDYSARRKAEA